MIPGEYFIDEKPITANVGKSTSSVSVRNTGDRPVQVGSHMHFFETNKALEFARNVSYGYHLNIPSGTSVRFEPGETKKVELTKFGGKRVVFGFNGLVNGSLKEEQGKAFQNAIKRGFKGTY